MFASTVVARALIRKAFNRCGVPEPVHTYTEKTTKNDPKRRSVVFPIYGAFKADQVSKYAREFLQDAGYTKSKVTLTTTLFEDRYYIRVIAYKD